MSAGETPEADDHRAYRSSVRDWYEANATPKQAADPWAINLHADQAEARAHFDAGRTWQRRLFDAGYMGITWPTEYGGQGGTSEMSRVEQEIAHDYEESTGFIAASTAMLGPTLLRHATEEQKREFIPKLLSSDLTFCQLFSEPGAGSDLASLAARGVVDGEELVVNGQKVWNSAAQYCDWGFLLVRTDPDAPKHRGITFVLVDMSSPGIEVRPLVQINRSAHFNEVFLSDVRIPLTNVVGDLNEGWAAARTVMANESAFIGRLTAPTGKNLIELARHNGRLGDPVVRQSLARFLTRERIIGWMGAQIQQAIRRREMPPMDPGLIKLMAAENRARSGQLAMELMGPEALAGGSAPTRWSQNELMMRFAISIGGGTDEVLRNNIGQRALGLPREPGYDKSQSWSEIPR